MNIYYIDWYLYNINNMNVCTYMHACILVYMLILFFHQMSSVVVRDEYSIKRESGHLKIHPSFAGFELISCMWTSNTLPRQ